MSQSKQFLSFVRQGDFAHPGEIEAIHMAMDCIKKNPAQRILDVGCGLGGTADYLQQQGWGKVTGIDIDYELIQYAKSHYPECSFFHADILQSENLLSENFQVIYSFSAFFCFKSQQEALHQLAKIADKDCELIIFDYSCFDESTFVSPFPWSNTASNFHPVYLPKLKQQLEMSGWQFKSSKDISHDFQRWYTQLLHRFDLKKDEIILKFGEEFFNKMYEGYKQLLLTIDKKQVGGRIIYASKE